MPSQPLTNCISTWLSPHAQSSCRHLLIWTISEYNEASTHTTHNWTTQPKHNSDFNIFQFGHSSWPCAVSTHFKERAVVPYWETCFTPYKDTSKCRRPQNCWDVLTMHFCCGLARLIFNAAAFGDDCKCIPEMLASIKRRRHEIRSRKPEVKLVWWVCKFEQLLRLCNTPVWPAKTHPMLWAVSSEASKTTKMCQMTRLKKFRCVKWRV